MKQLILSVIVTLSFFNAVAQLKDSLTCPTIKLDGPKDNSVFEGKEAGISVKSFKKDFLKSHSLSYEWVTVNGLITDGKNKSSVYIDTKGLAGKQIKAAVIINGLDAGCPSTAAITIDVVQPTIIRTEQRIVGRSRN